MPLGTVARPTNHQTCTVRYTEEEVNPARLKTKAGKIWYIAKLVAVVGYTLDAQVDVSAAKVVAGLEVVQTLGLLHQLAQAAQTPEATWRAATARVHASAAQRKQRELAAEYEAQAIQMYTPPSPPTMPVEPAAGRDESLEEALFMRASRRRAL